MFSYELAQPRAEIVTVMLKVTQQRFSFDLSTNGGKVELVVYRNFSKEIFADPTDYFTLPPARLALKLVEKVNLSALS